MKAKQPKQKRRSSTNLVTTDNDAGLRSAKVQKGRETAASMHDPNIVLQGKSCRCETVGCPLNPASSAMLMVCQDIYKSRQAEQGNDGKSAGL